jgi:hypothetical protein
VIPDAPIDSRVCFALSVQPRSNSSSNWWHGPPFCIVIAKSPKIQVIGGDVIVGNASVGNGSYAGITRSANTWWNSSVDASTATLNTNGEESTRKAVSTYRFEVDGDTLKGTIDRTIEGLDVTMGGPQPITGKRAK